MAKNIKDGEKQNLHLRNRNRKPYDLAAMLVTNPALKSFIIPNKLGDQSINFSDPEGVKALNRAILHYYYGIKYWEFPDENLCPPVPGRAEYIHAMADLLAEGGDAQKPTEASINCLDVGVGASCIYPIIGVSDYNWNFIGSDIDSKSVQSAQNIADNNPSLKGKVRCRLQTNSKSIFKGILETNEKIDVVISNPPFHESKEAALIGSKRKVKNLSGKKDYTPILNFSGNTNELVYEGGEFQFISTMISESKNYAKQCFWFSCLVSKESNLKKISKVFHKHKPSEIRTLKISTGNKYTRVVCWTFLSALERKEW
jgi:23S rRNA (adenine1618-N6)-methyltransferase